MKVAVVREGGLDFSFPRIELGTGREPGGVLTSLSAGGLGPGEPKAGHLFHLAGEEQGETMSTCVWEGGLSLVFPGGCSLLVRHCQAEAGVRALAPGQGLWGSEGEGPPTLRSAPDACLMRPKLVRDPEHCGGGLRICRRGRMGSRAGPSVSLGAQQVQQPRPPPLMPELTTCGGWGQGHAAGSSPCCASPAPHLLPGQEAWRVPAGGGGRGRPGAGTPSRRSARCRPRGVAGWA